MIFSHKTRRAPEHLRGFKFERGQAVLILQAPAAHKGYITTVPGVVLNAGDYFITVQTDHGPKRVKPTILHHRGYCPLCEVAAHLDDGRLVCPRCEGDAGAPVPDRLLPEWTWPNQYGVCLDRTMLCHGCTQKEAFSILDRERRAQWAAMLERVGLTESYRRDRFWWADGTRDIEERMHSAAARGDADAFLEGVEQLKRMACHNAAYRLVQALDEQDGNALPTRPTADTEPDGADDLTRWLDGQFKNAA